MAAPIIAAVRERSHLKESLLHTAQELAHRASIYGVVRVSYGYLAQKCHCSRRTVMRHIQRLIDANILRKTVLWVRGNYCEVNTYTFLLAWDKRPTKPSSDKKTAKFPRQEEGEKRQGWGDKQRLEAKGLAFLTPGSLIYRLVTSQHNA